MNIHEALGLFEALADLSRLRIVKSLVEKTACGEELAARLGLASSTVSFHLKKLEAGGVVQKEKRQYYWDYSLAPEIKGLALSALFSADDPEGKTLEQRFEEHQRQVSREFFVGGKLTRWPAQLKKRLVILERLAGLFAVGRRYPEKEVNSLLQKQYPDYCLLRRELIDHGWLDRREGVYWRAKTSSRDVVLMSRQGSETETESEAEAIPAPVSMAPAKKEKKKPMETRAEMKRAYKENQTPAGILQIRNLKTGKIFLVASLNLQGAVNKHQFVLLYGSHLNKTLQKDYQALGAEGFVFETLETLKPKEDGTAPTIDDLKDREHFWLDKLQPWGDRGYNDEPSKKPRSPK